MLQEDTEVSLMETGWSTLKSPDSHWFTIIIYDHQNGKTNLLQKARKHLFPKTGWFMPFSYRLVSSGSILYPTEGA